jgi:hypothetical protein
MISVIEIFAIRQPTNSDVRVRHGRSGKQPMAERLFRYPGEGRAPSKPPYATVRRLTNSPAGPRPPGGLHRRSRERVERGRGLRDRWRQERCFWSGSTSRRRPPRSTTPTPAPARRRATRCSRTTTVPMALHLPMRPATSSAIVPCRTHRPRDGGRLRRPELRSGDAGRSKCGESLREVDAYLPCR